jgi:hypothetical protein
MRDHSKTKYIFQLKSLTHPCPCSLCSLCSLCLIMPFEGYLQDLCLLERECDFLLNITNSQIKAMASSYLDPKNDKYPDLSESTSEAMMRLNAELVVDGSLSIPTATSSVQLTNIPPSDRSSPGPLEQRWEEKGFENLAPTVPQPLQSTPQIAAPIFRSEDGPSRSTCTASSPVDVDQAQGE